MPADTAEMPARNAADVPSLGAGKMRLLTLDHLDGRTLAAKRARELIGQIESDLGGADQLSVAERRLIQRSAVLGAIIEGLEVAALAGEAMNFEQYLPALNAQRRVLETLGLRRRARDVTPSLREYLDAAKSKGAAA